MPQTDTRYAIVSTGKGQVYSIDYDEECVDLLFRIMKVIMYNTTEYEANIISKRANKKLASVGQPNI